MALPPKGDPRRPLHLAIRSCQLLGLIFILVAMLASLAVFASPRGPAWFGVAAVVLVVATPGILYVMTAIFLRRRRPWAVVMGLVVASLHALFALLAFVASLINAAASPIPVIVTLLWVLALAQLIFHLSQSSAAMRADQAYQQRGFEVIPTATPVEEIK